MTFVSIDQIVKNILLKRRYPFQYYINFLVYAAQGVKELSYDLPMNPVKYKVLTLNDNHAIEIPNDYQDWTGVFVRRDQYLTPLIEDNTLDLVPNYDSSFVIQPYSSGIASLSPADNQVQLYNGYLSGYFFMVNWDVMGENLGRQFGGIGSSSDTFRVNPSRNEIKINENLTTTEVVLEYIGNGLDNDSATKINGYAQFCIESFCMWQHYLHNRTYSQNEADDMEMKYVKERQVLTARLSDITLDRLKRIVQSNSIGLKY